MRKLIIFEIYSLDKLLNKNQLCQKAETDSHISDQVEMDIKCQKYDFLSVLVSFVTDDFYLVLNCYVIMLHFIS